MVPFSRSEKGTPVNPVGPNNSDFILGQNTSLERRVFFVLAALALIYAFLAGFHTVWRPPDTGWQMALPGAGPFQHRSRAICRCFFVPIRRQTSLGHIPSGAGVVLYLAYLGQRRKFTLLGSWISACCRNCGHRRHCCSAEGSSASAAIAIIAVPMIAQRTQPRADMFSVVTSLRRISPFCGRITGRPVAQLLWLLPMIMLVWVNFHFGFAAGLGLIACLRWNRKVFETPLVEGRTQSCRRTKTSPCLECGWLLQGLVTFGEFLGMGHLPHGARGVPIPGAAEVDRRMAGRPT